MNRLWMRGGWVVCALALAACSPNLGLPPGAQVQCASNADCPEQTSCQTAIGRCVPDDALGGGPPALADAGLSPPFIQAGARLTATFDSTKPLIQPPTLWAEVHGQTLALEQDTAASSGQHYVFHYASDGGEPQGVANVFAKLVDTSGNSADALLVGHATFDFTAPGVSFAAVEYLPASDNPIGLGATAATVGTTIRVKVSSDEDLRQGGTPMLTASNGVSTLTFDLEDAGTNEAVFVVTVDGGVTDSPDLYAPHLTGWTDLAGNSATAATFTDPPIVVRVSKPALTVAQQDVTYVRSPFGNGAAEPLDGGFTVPAGAWFELAPGDSLSGSPTLPAGAFQTAGTPIAAVQVWSPDLRSVLGGVRPNSDGTWPRIGLTPVDFPRVYVTALDGAGNASDPVAIENAEWVATMRSAALNRSVLATTPFAWDALGPNPDDFLVGPGEQVSATDSSDALVVKGEPAWRRLLPGTPPTARAGQAMAYDARRGAVYLFGGGLDPNNSDDQFWMWDGTRWRQIPKAGAWPKARWYASMAYDAADDRLLLFGGKGSLVNAEQNDFYNDLWEWDGAQWTEIAPSGAWPNARIAASMAYDTTRSRLVLFGGSIDNTTTPDPKVVCPSFCYDPSVWEWDGSAWQRLDPTPAPSPRLWSVMSYDARRGQTVLFGGLSDACGGASTFCADTWVWDGSTWSSPSTPTHPDPRAQASMAFDDGRGRTVLYGGTSTTAPAARQDVWEWDGAAWTNHTPASGTQPPPIGGTMAYLPTTAHVVEFGDPDGGVGSNNDVFEWDGQAWSRRPAAPTNPNISTGSVANDFPAVYDSRRDRVVMFAGVASPGLISTQLWEYDGTAWTYRPDAGTWPTPRRDVALAFDATRGTTVMFGGDNQYGGPGTSQVTNEIWEWNGSTWANRTPGSGGPQGAHGAVLVYNGDTGVDVMIGPKEISGIPPIETMGVWNWNGAWSEKTPATGPTPSQRWYASAAYDPGRGVVVFFGGNEKYAGQGETLRNDVWEWNGSTWSQRTPVGDLPVPRQRARMAYDPNRGAVVLFGGLGAGDTPLDDLWQWDGTRWTNLTPTEAGVRPSARYAHGMVYAATRKRLEVFAGVDDLNQDPADLWVLDESLGRAPGIQFDAVSRSAQLGHITQLRVRADCGGSDAAGGTPGAQLFAWSNGFGESSSPGWKQVGATSAAVDAVPPYLALHPAPLIDWKTTTGAEVQRYYLGRDGKIAVRCRPVAGANPQDPSVAMKFVEARFRYTTTP